MGYPVNMEKTEEKKRPGTFENQSAHWSTQTKQNSGHLVFSFFHCPAICRGQIPLDSMPSRNTKRIPPMLYKHMEAY
jgi:hypothetical protein